MYEKALHLVCAAARRWQANTFLLQISSTCSTTGSHIRRLKTSYSVLKRELALKKFASKSKENGKEKQQMSPPTSLLAQRLMMERKKGKEQNINDDIQVMTSQTDDKEGSSSSNDLKSKLEALTEDLDYVISELAIDIDDSKLFDNKTKETKNVLEYGDSFFEETSDYQSVESVAFLDDFKQSMKLKASPILGTEDPSVPVSNTPCVGCGALLQCQHNTFPGYMPSENFKVLSEKELKMSLCQRCYYIQHCDAFVEVSTKPQEFAAMISKIRPTKSVVVMVVDVMDIQGSIVPHLMDYIGYKHPLMIVGNKADLLSPDCPDYLKHVNEQLRQACYDAGLKNIQKCTLISAKTGFGIEKLIDMLFYFYKRKVDVFIVGTANAGKSSLFNTLLGSDYCKHTARDLIQRATVSVWPGTTLNLLKFPIMWPSSRTNALRKMRLSQEQAQNRELKRIQQSRKKGKEEKLSSWQLEEKVTLTDVRTDTQRVTDMTGDAWGQEVHGYKCKGDGTVDFVDHSPKTDPFEADSYDNSYWTYDTPGVINPNQVINLLTPEEAPFLAPHTMIVPRSLLLKPHETVFVSGLARLDYVEGETGIVLAVHSAPNLPIHVVPTEEADKFYEENVGTKTLAVPLGGKDRFMKLPSLVGKEFDIEGQHESFSVADIQLSSVGWISIAPKKGNVVSIRAYTPGRKGMYLRTPALMPRHKNLTGKRIGGTSFFETKPPGWVMAKRNDNDVPEL